MAILITHHSALEYWLNYRRKPMPTTLIRKIVAPCFSPPNSETLEQTRGLGLIYPLDVMVKSPKEKRSQGYFRNHVIGKPLPEGSVFDTGNEVYVASPELCFIQLSNYLTVPQLLHLSMELCGTYSLPLPDTHVVEMLTDPKTLFDIPPLYTTTRLSSFIDKAIGLQGQPNAAKALRYLADGSASPMETILYLLLTLPYKLGGYALPKPQLNPRINLPDAIRLSSKHEYYKCDLYWPDFKLAVEYDSDLHHTGPSRLASDSMRRKDLALLGIKVVTVTRQEVRYIEEFNKTALLIAKLLGIRLRNNEAAGFTFAQAELRKVLLEKR